jgi:RNA polymerase sigma factor (TIGR02999 family)
MLLPVSEPAGPGEITQLLRRLGTGDGEAAERLACLVQAELRRMAARFLASERAAKTLQPTALVHEAWLRIVPAAAREYQGRGHFMAIAARAMRQILVEHARARDSLKRGGRWQRVSLSAVPPGLDPEAALNDLLDLDRAIGTLADAHPRAARVVELRLFGGLTIAEAGEALGVSHATIEEDWILAKAWLSRALRSR